MNGKRSIDSADHSGPFWNWFGSAPEYVAMVERAPPSLREMVRVPIVAPILLRSKSNL